MSPLTGCFCLTLSCFVVVDLPENATELLSSAPAMAPPPTSTVAAAGSTTTGSSIGGFGSIYASSTQPTSISLFLSSTSSSIFSRPEQNPPLYTPSPQPSMSATALLQKAAQMGATASNSCLLRGLGLAMSSTSYGNDTTASTSGTSQWSTQLKVENDDSAGQGLGLGLASRGSSGISGLMMESSSLFGTKPMTLDFLGLGMGPGDATTSGLSALFTSLEGGFAAAPATSFGGLEGRQSSGEGA